VVLQREEHLRHVGKAKLARVMLPECMKLACGNLIALDAVRLGE
jgi:hypothetical protein